MVSGHLHQYCCCFSPMFHHNWHEWGQEWVTRGHQSEAGGWSLDSLTQYSRWRAPVLLAVGVHSAISGLSPALTSLRPLSVPGPPSVHPERPELSSAWASSCWSEWEARTEAGQPGPGERERVQSPGSGHHQTSEQSHRGSLHCIIITCHTSSHNHRGLWINQRSRRNFYVTFKPLQQLLKCLGEKSMILDKANLTKSFCKHLVFARQRV